MYRILTKTNPFYGVILILAAIVAFEHSIQAAVGQFDVPLRYKNRVVPSLNIRSYPDGFSSIKENQFLLKFNKINYSWVYDLISNKEYVYLTLKAGDYILYQPLAVPLKQFAKDKANRKMISMWSSEMANYTGTKSKKTGGEGIQIPINIEIPKQVRSLVGEGGPRITVTGSRKIAFSGKSEWEDGLVNTGTFRQSKFPSLHMEQTSRFKIKGDIGSKISVEVDQDSNRDTDLANTLKLRYKGEEDDILQTVEAGNTNLSLPNAQFIGFSQNVQGLFGIKATAKIANTELTFITSQEKGAAEKSTFSAGAQGSQDTIYDYNYLHNVYFWLGLPGEFNPVTDTLLRIFLYQKGTALDHSAYAKICVNPGLDLNSTLPEQYTLYDTLPGEVGRGESFEGWVKIIEASTGYTVIQSDWYIIMNQALTEDDFLAVYIEYAHRDPVKRDSLTSPVLRKGSISGDTLVLKTIKARTPNSQFTTWSTEWRNVYDLRSRDISSNGFDLKIFKGQGDINNDTMDQGGVCYITLLGLDSLNNTSLVKEPDCLFDFTNAVINAARGHLIFPGSYYFQSVEPFNSSVLNTRVPEIYNLEYSNSNRQSAQTYYLYVKTARRSNTYSLGHTNIIENSDVVKLGDGRTLTRGTDYRIDYDLGQITFLNEDALNPVNNVSVDFSYAPFFIAEKKSLYGLSAKYNINDKSWVSWAGMYRRETVADYRPRVGGEPRRSMMWDSNFIFGFEPKIMTAITDALPFIETESASRLELSGEVAQSFPNPNTRKNAYIDDFEGVREYTDLLTRRGIWTTASTPYNGYQLSDKRKIWWYNPYNPYLLTQIWPERSVRDQDNKTDVLVVEYAPTSDSILNPTSAWSGIMRPLFSGMNDQSKTQFIEIWYFPDTSSRRNDNPILHIDAGKITEDLNGDGSNTPNTEDRNFNGVFEQDEDIGLDGLADVNEPGYNASTNPDPNGDNWSYKTNTEQERNDYSRINGTEGNRNDPDRLNRFDTEDINNNGYCDNTNAYFEYDIDLNAQDFVVDSTSTGWKLLRIPFQDSTVYRKVGGVTTADFNQIKFIRLWFSNATRRYTIKFASIQLVGNKWRRAPLAAADSNITFEVTVKNTQENTGYNPPPGIIINTNPETGVVEKEQSLVLRYENLNPGQTVKAYWYLYQPEDYTLYNKMKMFVHGDQSTADGKMKFFFRMGQDTTANTYYEYTTILDQGWTENNTVEIDFAELTGLKSRYQNAHPDSIAYTDTSSGHYHVKGNPSLSSVRCFVIGLTRDSSAVGPVSGEVWCDELVVNEVRRQSDLAGRLALSMQFADLFSLTMNYSRTGADFVRLLDRKPGGSLMTSKTVSTTFNLHKFAPPSWKLSLPVTYSWQKSLQLPRLMPGSDIILPSDLRDKQRTESSSWAIQMSEQINKTGAHWLWGLTLNRITTRFSYSKQTGLSPSTPVSRARIYSASAVYDLTPRAKPFVKPFTWMKYLYIPAGLSQAKLNYLPTNWRYDATVNSNKTYSLSQRKVVTSAYTRDLAINQSYGIELFSGLRNEFSMSTNRDISNPDLLKLDWDPRNIRLGRERTYSQRYSMSFSPRFSRLIAPRFQFNSNYSDNSDITQNQNSGRATQMGGTFRTEMNLDLLDLLGIKKTSSPKGTGSKPDVTSPKNGEQEDERGEGESKKGPSLKLPNPVKGATNFLNMFRTLKPLNMSYNLDKRISANGLLARPGWMYTLGLADNPNVERSTSIGVGTRDQKAYTTDYSFGTGLTPVRNLDLNTSYKYRIGITRSSSEPTRNTSLEFPHLDMTLSGVEKFPVLKKISKTANLQTSYTRKVDISSNADTKEKYSRGTQIALTPLLNLNATLIKDVRFSSRYDYSKRKTENLRMEGSNQKTSYGTDRSIKFTLDYSFSAPQGLKFPLMGKLKFDSQLTISATYTKRFMKNWSILKGDKTVESDRVETSVEPRATYRFSAKINAGLNARWVDTNDKIQQRKRHTRELGIWTELRF